MSDQKPEPLSDEDIALRRERIVQRKAELTDNCRRFPAHQNEDMWKAEYRRLEAEDSALRELQQRRAAQEPPADGGAIQCDSPADAHLAAMLGNVLSADGYMVNGPQVVDLVNRIRREGWQPAPAQGQAAHQLAEAWWRGRRSVGPSWAQFAGPELQEMCRKDIADLVPAEPQAQGAVSAAVPAVANSGNAVTCCCLNPDVDDCYPCRECNGKGYVR